MIEKILINLFVAVVEIIAFNELCRRFRKQDGFNKYIAVVCVAVYMAMSVIITIYLNHSIIVLGMIICMLVAYSFSYRMKLHKRIIAAAFVIILGVAYEMMIFLLVGVINNISPEEIQNNTELYLLSCVICKFLLYFTIKAFVLLVKPEGSSISKRHNALILLMPISSIAVLMILSRLSYSSQEVIDKILILVVAVLLISANIGVLIINDVIIKRESRILRQKLDIEAFERDRKEYSYIIDSQIKSNKEMHDWKHKMYTLKSMISEDSSGASMFIDELCKSASESKVQKYIDKDDINAILNVKKGLAESKNIDMTINAILIDEIYINSMDLCVLLGNMLDNSIEACEGVERRNAYINLDISTKGEFLAITCKNNTSNDAVFAGTTNKKNVALDHGYGLNKIIEIVNQYDGNVEFEIVASEFSMYIIMKNCRSRR